MSAAPSFEPHWPFGPALLPQPAEQRGRFAPFARFEPISLPELESVALLDRRDLKFVTSEPLLSGLIPALASRYRVLEVEGTRAHTYRTVYFDTPAFDLFRAHHNHRPLRYKVRSRLYEESRMAFFEVKTRDSRARTRKARTPTAHMITDLSPEESLFVASHAPYPAGALVPSLFNAFSRVTLVDLAGAERLTLDFGITFAANGETAYLPGLVVAELKHMRSARESAFLPLARSEGLQPVAFSKYCVGVSLLYRGVKHNAFNPQLRLARRITGETDVR